MTSGKCNISRIYRRGMQIVLNTWLWRKKTFSHFKPFLRDWNKFSNREYLTSNESYIKYSGAKTHTIPNAVLTGEYCLHGPIRSLNPVTDSSSGLKNIVINQNVM